MKQSLFTITLAVIIASLWEFGEYKLIECFIISIISVFIVGRLKKFL